MKLKISIVINNEVFDFIVNHEMQIYNTLEIIYQYKKQILPKNAKYVYSHITKTQSSLNFTFKEASIQNGDKLEIKELTNA